ncbi:hypothetical protein GCM10017044_04560 [Kordiimonas sediminis]|uniref:AraC-type arabinose-binding/dimerisation domain-containing protein n=1 Tax=Kordiimonas sediminis TaxID=1735581 RepID=A0A919ALZ4_9PROT|nr:AraC family ligand binding domain-containing protein [Kordiimonas sediminis]GHF13576.1 hypothetical protein GCM10017044_04560 [Kordiimonas sediminis]
MVKIIHMQESLKDGESPTSGMMLSEAFDLPVNQATLKTGFASFKADVRQPPEGLVSREEVEISLILSGDTELYTPDRTYVLKAGDLVMIPPGVPNAAKALTDLTVYYMLCG